MVWPGGSEDEGALNLMFPLLHSADYTSSTLLIGLSWSYTRGRERWHQVRGSWASETLSMLWTRPGGKQHERGAVAHTRAVLAVDRQTRYCSGACSTQTDMRHVSRWQYRVAAVLPPADHLETPSDDKTFAVCVHCNHNGVPCFVKFSLHGLLSYCA